MHQVIEHPVWSSQQWRLLTVARVSGQALARCIVTIDGRVEDTRLRDSLIAAVERHQILCVDGMAGGAAAAGGAVPRIAHVSWRLREVTEDDAYREAMSAAPQDGGAPVDVQLLRVATDRSLLVITTTALRADACSLLLVVADLCAAYGGRSLAPPATLQYRVFAQWQAQEAGAAVIHDTQDHAAAEGIAAEPTVAAPPIAAASTPLVFETELDGVATAAAIDAAAAWGVTLPSLLQACWCVVLWRANGELPAIAVQHDDRDDAILRDIVGPIARWLQPNARATAADTVGELARRIERATDEAVASAPLTTSADDPVPCRTYGFEYRTQPPPVHVEGATFAVRRLEVATEPFLLRLSCVRVDDRLSLAVIADAAGEAASSAASLRDAVVAAMASAADTMAKRIADVDLLGPIARRIGEQMRGPERARTPRCAHHLFEDVVDQCGEMVAIEASGERLTYADLEAWSNRIAHVLLTAAVRIDEPVGLLIDRSPAAVAAMLGIQKAGAAYLPLETSWPPARTGRVLHDARARVLVTVGDDCRVADWSGRTISIARDAEAIAAAPQTRPGVAVQPDNLAYVIYTSGSTGSPKGVMVQHDALHNYLCWSAAAYAADQGDAVVQSPLSFDLTVTSLWLPLVSGHRAVLVQSSDELAGLAAAAADPAVTLIKVTPAHLQVLAELPGIDKRAWDGKVVVVGGEALHGSTLDPWRLAAPHVRFVNEYGPTETVVGCCVHEATADDSGGPVPIGRPIANTCLAVQDRFDGLALPGVPGELAIGGDAVARGYLGQPALTAERFVPDPFSPSPGRRMYRTGDRVVRRQDGRLDYCGRVDRQVKVRGFRIELGEVEAALCATRAVSQAVVDVQRESGDTRLLAYVVPRLSSDEVAALRQRLAMQLPAYMLPSVIVSLDALPLTHNGKVDRPRLAALATASAEATDAVAASPIEELLGAMWSDLLKLDRVGPETDFFESGGHSLLASRLVARIAQTLGVEIPLRRVFETPRLGALAEQIERERNSGRGVALPPIQRGDDLMPAPLSASQQRLWFLHQLDPDSAAYNCAFGIRLHGPLDRGALARGVAEVVNRHAVLRTSFPLRGDQPVQHIGAAGETSIDTRDLSDLDEQERAAQLTRLSEAHGQRPFDLAAGPPYRVTLVRLADTEHVVLFAVHHIAFDGWSVGVLARELTAVYSAIVAGTRPALAQLDVQYSDYARWQADWLRGDILEAHVRFWQRALAGAPSTLDLPNAGPHVASSSGRVGRVGFRLPADISERLRHLRREVGVTTFMTVISAFAVVLADESGQGEVVIGTDVANRPARELETLIGFFVNVLPIRVRVDRRASFVDLLRQVRETALDAYAHQALPFDKIVEATQPPRTPGRNPLVQVLCVLQNAPNERLALPQVHAELFGDAPRPAKFDLALFAAERHDHIAGALEYNAALFDASQAERLAQRFVTALAAMLAAPNDSLRSVSMQAHDPTASDPDRQVTRQESNRRKLQAMRTRTIAAAAVSPVRDEPLSPDTPLPRLIVPQQDRVVLAEWAAANRSFVRDQLHQYGGVLFRGFDLRGAADFERVAASLCSELFGEYGDLPRAGMGGRIYESTPYPPDQPILFHNESSHLQRWPTRIFFFCEQPSETGGETPIVDCRAVLRRLDRGVADRLREKGLMYVRRFVPGLDVRWQDFFHTSNRAEVEAICRTASVDFEWNGDELVTRTVCDAIVRHPVTGDETFFNQIQLHHPSCLPQESRAALVSLFGADRLPRQVLYGDGSPIDDAIVDEIGRAYDDTAVAFPWRAGDLVALDNMLVAHGRRPFTGKRRIVVALGDIIGREAIAR